MVGNSQSPEGPFMVFAPTDAAFQAFAQSASGVSSPWKLDTKTLVYLHSPSTSSSTTYQIYARSESATGITVNYAYSDTDNSDRVRLLSTITLMEIAG